MTFDSTVDTGVPVRPAGLNAGNRRLLLPFDNNIGESPQFTPSVYYPNVDPEGVLVGNPGDIALRPGMVWIKASGGATRTGWLRSMTSGGSDILALEGWGQDNPVAGIIPARQLRRWDFSTNDSTASNATMHMWEAPWAGRIRGVSVTPSGNKTAGTITFIPAVNNVGKSTLQLSIGASQENWLAADFSADQIFAAGDRLSIQIATDGDYLPVTLDWRAFLWVSRG